ncbi:MAG: hypothetical protein LAP87_00810 [Acidobacteriia bacterium]|nr:hypothetical protein [Terriglobia bacterium]
MGNMVRISDEVAERLVQMNDRTVLVSGRWIKVAAVKDEIWQEGDVVPDPYQFIASIRQRKGIRADIFTFSQKLTDTAPRFPFQYEWESVAAIPIVSYADWWTNRVSTDFRCDVRKAAKRGVTVRLVPFTEELVRAIVEIYDETPIRQGRPFWHYRKGFDFAQRANSTYVDRSDFLGAYVGGDLIGFLKIVYVDRVARLMQIIAKDAHRDKRPMAALIAKAVEVCASKGCSHLTYGKYRYAQGADSVTAFKHRNGFEEVLVPQYYVPLTIKGRLALHLRLQRGPKALVPHPLLRWLRRIRASLYRYSLRPGTVA